MPLRDWEPERVAVLHKGEALLTVRGLNLLDIQAMVSGHLPELRHLSTLWEGAQDEIFATVMQDEFLVRLIAEVPSVAGMILALGSDNPGEEATVLRLPLGYQLVALKEIVRLTLEDVGGPKGVAALIKGAMSKANPVSAATTTETMS